MLRELTSLSLQSLIQGALVDTFLLRCSWIVEAHGSLDHSRDDFYDSIADRYGMDDFFAIWPSASCGEHSITDLFLASLFPIYFYWPVGRLSLHNRIAYSSDEDFYAFAVRNAYNKNTLT